MKWTFQTQQRDLHTELSVTKQSRLENLASKKIEVTYIY